SNQLNTTTSSSLACTALRKSVSVPSGTSSPQHSTIRLTPNSLKSGAASAACLRHPSLLTAGTATKNPSTYFIIVLLSRKQKHVSRITCRLILPRPFDKYVYINIIDTPCQNEFPSTPR